MKSPIFKTLFLLLLTGCSVFEKNVIFNTSAIHNNTTIRAKKIQIGDAAALTVNIDTSKTLILQCKKLVVKQDVTFNVTPVLGKSRATVIIEYSKITNGNYTISQNLVPFGIFRIEKKKIAF